MTSDEQDAINLATPERQFHPNKVDEDAARLKAARLTARPVKITPVEGQTDKALREAYGREADMVAESLIHVLAHAGKGDPLDTERTRHAVRGALVSAFTSGLNAATQNARAYSAAEVADKFVAKSLLERGFDGNAYMKDRGEALLSALVEKGAVFVPGKSLVRLALRTAYENGWADLQQPGPIVISAELPEPLVVAESCPEAEREKATDEPLPEIPKRSWWRALAGMVTG